MVSKSRLRNWKREKKERGVRGKFYCPDGLRHFDYGPGIDHGLRAVNDIVKKRQFYSSICINY